MIFTIFAASWDFLSGFAGQVSFGQAIFLGIGGYFTAFLFRDTNTPWWLSILIGAIVAVGFGLIIGIPSLRLKGPYLALGTMVFSLIIFDSIKRLLFSIPFNLLLVVFRSLSAFL